MLFWNGSCHFYPLLGLRSASKMPLENITHYSYGMYRFTLVHQIQIYH